jgi:hypothetical protein
MSYWKQIEIHIVFPIWTKKPIRKNSYLKQIKNNYSRDMYRDIFDKKYNDSGG